ncbi:phosphoserine phosphatase SerB [Flexivirga caeni]|uniref:phosphoserine phosphatase n=1 Tax=Flexivirga caeni TaxID=2294115 RepID=A0A3M9MJ19_9MICO|nr:phosphoserine phosphatase SerB [Flexivirga caeni]RNI24668.1 phosphoserine phosphatase SerB [Flexivirga caeni]
MNSPGTQHDSPYPTVLITLVGTDRPGVSADLLAVAAQSGSHVLDLEQAVVRGRLLLTALLQPTGPADELSGAIDQLADRHGLNASVEPGHGDNPSRRTGRASVVVLGSPLGADDLAEVTAAIGRQGANIDRIRRLSRDPVTTIEFDLSGADVPSLRRTLALIAAERSLDLAVAPGGLARRGKRLLVMDVDSTLIQDEVIELLAAHAGREREVAEVTERAMRGELDFAASLRERVGCLAGLDVSVFGEVRRAVRLTPGARTLVRTVQRLGYAVAVVSGGFLEIVGPLATDLGIDHAHANRLEVRDGRLTGRVDGEIVDRAGKALALRRFADAENLPLSRTVAIGDGANDLDMLAAAGLGIAFNAKPVVRDQADASVSVPYLDTVLFMLGISRDEVDEADRVAAGGDATGHETSRAAGAASLDSPHA